RVAGAVIVIAFFVIGYTPMMRGLVRGLNRRDELRPAPAVVVLGSSAHRNGTLSNAAQERAVAGYAVLREGYAPRPALTFPASPDAPAWHTGMQHQMQSLRFDYAVDV